MKLIRTKIHENLWSDYKTYGFFANEEQFSKNKTTSGSKSLHKKRNPYSVGAKSRRENRHSYKKENRNKFMMLNISSRLYLSVHTMELIKWAQRNVIIKLGEKTVWF